VLAVGKLQASCKASCHASWCGKATLWRVTERHVGDGNAGIFCEVKHVLLVVNEAAVSKVTLTSLNFAKPQACFSNRVDVQVDSGICPNRLASGPLYEKVAGLRGTNEMLALLH
tara:strand:- start:5791 stop:6132 length:342 start_codon:yes stop_codon:yes gene_type:complete